MNISDLHSVNPYNDFDHTQYSLDVQTWEPHNKLFEELILQYTPSLIIEVGTWFGGSAFQMADIVKKHGLDTKILCVDTWLGSLQFWQKDFDRVNYNNLKLKHGYPTFYYQFLANVKHKKHDDIIIPFPQPSRIAADWVRSTGKKANLIYIDASHEYKDVYDDVSSWYDNLDYNGVIFGDDYNWPSVKTAVDRYAKEINLRSLATPKGYKWAIQKEGVQDFGLLISSHINYSVPRKRLLKSIEAYGFPKDKVFVAIGGCVENKIQKENGILTSYATHNSFDHTACIEFCRNSFLLNHFPNDLLLLHDTMEITPNTYSAVKKVDPTKKAISASGTNFTAMCNLILVKKQYLLSESPLMYSFVNCSKQTACNTEGTLFRQLPYNERGYFPNTNIDVFNPENIYGGAPRIKEFYHGPQLFKYKGNWGQSNKQWTLKP